MTLVEQAKMRLALAEVRERRPVRWFATPEVAASVGEDLHGVPVEVGTPRSEWGLQLVCDEVSRTA